MIQKFCSYVSILRKLLQDILEQTEHFLAKRMKAWVPGTGSGSNQEREKKGLVQHLHRSPGKWAQIGAEVRTASGSSILMEELESWLEVGDTQMNEWYPKELKISMWKLCE